MLCVHVTLEVLEVSILLVADLTDAELLGGRVAHLTNHTLVTVVLLQPREILVTDIAGVRSFTCTVGK